MIKYHQRLFMPIKREIVYSITNMLNQRYNRVNNVTIRPVLERHLKETYHFRRGQCGRTADKISHILEEKGIFQPYIIREEAIKRTWSIDFDKLSEFLETTE